MDAETGGVAVSTTRSGYSVGNIVAIIGVMLVAVALALYGFFGNPTRGNPLFIGVLFTGFAVFLGVTAIGAIRSRRH